MKRSNYKKNIFLTLSGIMILSSCSDTYDLDSENLIDSSPSEVQLQTTAVPIGPVVVVVIVDIISKVVNGKVYKHIEYYENGNKKSEIVMCKGLLGTCKITIADSKTSNSVTNNEEEELISYDGEIKQYNTELIRSNIGILYAVNKNYYQDQADKLFNSDIFEIRSNLVIDDKAILNELGLSESITVYGKYKVYENKDYKFIIIHE